MVPAPVQSAAQVALEDDAHVLAQRSRYGHRREILRDAMDRAGFQVAFEAGLYLWCTRGEPAMPTVDWFAERGILVGPGTVYGHAGQNHVRIADRPRRPSVRRRRAAGAPRPSLRWLCRRTP